MSTNRWQKRQAETRQAFMIAALELILVYGYDKVTVTDIAERADYGRSTFYLHFADKEAVAFALIEYFQIEMDAAIQTHVAGMPSPQREYVAWQMIFNGVEQQKEFFLQMDGETSRRLRQMQKDILIARYTQQLRDGMYDLQIDAPPEIAARFIVGAITEILEYWINHPEIAPPDDMTVMFFRLVFRQNPPQSTKIDYNEHNNLN